MSLLSRTLQALVPGMPTVSAVAAQVDHDMAKILIEFREQRAEDFAAMADRAGRSGARLAEAEHELRQWQLYARALETACLAAGLELPEGPDDGD